MKKLLWLMTIAMSLFFMSCDEDWAEVSTEDLLGTWKFYAGSLNTEHHNQHYTYPDFRPDRENSGTSFSNGSNKNSQISWTEESGVAYLEFLENGRFEGFNSAFAIRGSFEVGPDHHILITIEEADYSFGDESEWAFLFDRLLEKMVFVKVINDRLILKDGLQKKELIFRKVVN